MNFIKMQTTGRDYILINRNEIKNSNKLPSLARFFCNRYYGIGASSLITVTEDVNCLYTDIFSPLGEKIELDASAAVCSAAYSFSCNKKTQQNIKQGENNINILIEEANGSYEITADLGKGTFLPSQIPLSSQNPVVNRGVEVGNRILNMTALRIGNSFAVHETEFSNNPNFLLLGEQITRHSLFNKKASAVFCERLNDSSVYIRSYINGVGAVLSDICASAAAVTAMCRTGKLDYGKEITVKNEGGEIYVLCKKNNAVLISTSVSTIFKGEIQDI